MQSMFKRSFSEWVSNNGTFQTICLSRTFTSGEVELLKSSETSKWPIRLSSTQLTLLWSMLLLHSNWKFLQISNVFSMFIESIHLECRLVDSGIWTQDAMTEASHRTMPNRFTERRPQVWLFCVPIVHELALKLTKLFFIFLTESATEVSTFFTSSCFQVNKQQKNVWCK